MPTDWKDWSLDKRKIFWGGGVSGESYTLGDRDVICAAEVWYELYGKTNPPDRRSSQEINAVLRMLPGWEEIGKLSRGFGKGYGPQRGFKRVGEKL